MLLVPLGARLWAQDRLALRAGGTIRARGKRAMKHGGCRAYHNLLAGDARRAVDDEAEAPILDRRPQQGHIRPYRYVRAGAGSA